MMTLMRLLEHDLALLGGGEQICLYVYSYTVERWWWSSSSCSLFRIRISGLAPFISISPNMPSTCAAASEIRMWMSKKSRPHIPPVLPTSSAR